MLGFEEAIKRANLALEAGADIAFVEAPQTLEEVRAVPKPRKGAVPAQHGVERQDAGSLARRSPEDWLPADDLPGPAVKATMGACDEALAELGTGTASDAASEMTIKAGLARIGADEWEPLRERFRDPSLKLAG